MPASSPRSSTTAASTPGSGVIADPGLQSVTPGRGAIISAPVSVCHQVSTIGQRPSPTTRWYHSQASGLIGSPTDPRSRSDRREAFLTGSSPACIRDRMAVGAV